MQEITHTMNDCPRFGSCRAPICPLDKLYKRRRMLEREPTCHYLRETAKPNWRKLVKGATDEWLYIVSQQMSATLQKHHRNLEVMLKESASTGSSIRPRWLNKNTYDDDRTPKEKQEA